MTTTRRCRPALAAGLGTLALAGCWPVPAANPDRTGHNQHETTIDVGTVADLTEQWRWTSTIPGQSPSAPVTSAGGVHVTVSCGVFTLDPETGAERWAASIPGVPDCNLPTQQHQGEPFVVDTPYGARLVASFGVTAPRPPGSILEAWTAGTFDPVTGAVDGRTSGGFTVALRDLEFVHSTVQAVAPFAAGRIVTVDGYSWTLHAGPNTGDLSPARGLTLGTDLVYHAGFAVLSSLANDPVFGDGVRAYARHSGPISGCGPVPGLTPVHVACPTWYTPTDGTPTTPVLHAASNTLLSRTSAGTLYAIDAATGAVRWTASGYGAAGAPIVVGDTVWLPTGTGQLQAFSVHGCGAATCQPSLPWHLDTGTGLPVTAAAAAGDHLVFASSGGSVFALSGCSQDGCAPLWQAPGSGSPVVSGGRLYVTEGLDLIAYGLP